MSHFARDLFPANSELLSVAPLRLSAWQRALALLGLWRERARTRRALAAIDPRSLRDAGIAPTQAAFEADQPFWRRPSSLR